MVSLIIAAAVKIAIMLGFALNLAGLLTWMERRQSAMMQDRIGPTRAGITIKLGKLKIGPIRIWGLLHVLADGVKMMTKEDFIPPKAHRAVFILAPIIALVPVLLIFAVVPFGPPVCLDQLGSVFDSTKACGQTEYLQIAHIDIGLLFIFAIASLSVYGAVLGGWASYNNYALLGGLRASAQMLSYEITMGMAIIGAIIVYGTLEPNAIVEQQQSLWDWGIFKQPLGFILFFAAAIAETKRAPFDLPEGESEIVGYFAEYSGTRFMTFMLGEFLEIVFVGCIVATIFFGGWQVPGLSATGLWGFELPHGIVVALGMLAFFFKVFVLCFLQLAIRWTLPRFRYDQLMQLGWKGLLPASILNVVLTAGFVAVHQAVNATQ